MKKTVNTMDESTDRKKIMQAWKDYTTEITIIVIEKAVKAFAQTINSCCRKLCFTNQGNHERDFGYGKKAGRVKIWILKKFKLINTIPEEITEDNLIEMRAYGSSAMRKKM